MIGKLRGTIDSYGEDWVIVDVGGVGYQVHCSSRTLQALPAVGEAGTLAIETYEREDVIRLYGFASDLEREWFRLLQTVQGVGAKVALAVLGTLKPGELASAIALQENCSAARRRPASPIRRAAAGSASTSRSVAASSPTKRSGSVGEPVPSRSCSIGTSRPVTPSSTTSGMPPVAVATTGSSQAIASRLTMPSGS